MNVQPLPFARWLEEVGHAAGGAAGAFARGIVIGRAAGAKAFSPQESYRAVMLTRSEKLTN